MYALTWSCGRPSHCREDLQIVLSGGIALLG